jgi:cytochrome c1
MNFSKKYSFLALIATVACYMVACKAGGENTGRVYMPDMAYSRAYETYAKAPEGSPLKYTSLLPVAGTVARGLLPEVATTRANENMIKSYMIKSYYPETPEGYEMSSELKNPLPVTKENIERGKALYVTYCTPCHGKEGDGNGQLVTADKYSGVPAYKDRLPTINDGKSYYSICYGKGKMGSHSSQINTTEIWKVVQYINTFVSGMPKFDESGAAVASNTVVTAKVAADTTKTKAIK